MPDGEDRINGARDGLNGLNALLQHRSRLGACVLLADAGSMSFSRLKELLDETDGNLGAQMRKLEEAGYVSVKKEFQQRKPVTWYSLTEQGRAALREHLDAMDVIVRTVKG